MAILTIWSISILIACNPKRVDTSNLKGEMKAREMKRITPNQISTFAGEWGKKIVIFLNKNVKNESLVDSLSKLYEAKIQKIDLTKINASQLDAKEQEVMSAYLYLVKENKPMVENLQKLKEGEIQIFTGPAREKNNIWRIEFTKKGIINKAEIKAIKRLTID